MAPLNTKRVLGVIAVAFAILMIFITHPKMPHGKGEAQPRIQELRAGAHGAK